MHLSSIQKDISRKLNSIKDELNKKLLEKERNNIMAQIHNIFKNEKMTALEDFEGNENNTTKMYEPVKKLNGWYPQKNDYQNKRRTRLKKSSQKSQQNTSKTFFIQTSHQC